MKVILVKDSSLRNLLYHILGFGYAYYHEDPEICDADFDKLCRYVSKYPMCLRYILKWFPEIPEIMIKDLKSCGIYCYNDFAKFCYNIYIEPYRGGFTIDFQGT